MHQNQVTTIFSLTSVLLLLAVGCSGGVAVESALVSPKLVRDLQRLCEILVSHTEAPGNSSLKKSAEALIQKLHGKRIEVTACEVRGSSQLDMTFHTGTQACNYSFDLVSLAGCGLPGVRCPTGPRVDKTCVAIRPVSIGFIMVSVMLVLIPLCAGIAILSVVKLLSSRSEEVAKPKSVVLLSGAV